MSQSNRSALKEWMLRAVLIGVSCFVALLLTEILARIFFPISDGRDNVALDGKLIKEWFAPGSVYRQVSNEYDAITTITKQGHRVPGVEGNPEVIFLGDSFTYGFGLNDSETFAVIYCEQLHLSCANLGIPGSGTLRQVERLETFIQEWNWKPKEVKLFFFGMSTSFSAGNDFADNYDRYMREHASQASDPADRRPAVREVPTLGMAERVIGLQSMLLERSALMRLVKYYWGPILKSLIVADFGKERMAVALSATKESLHKLDDLSRQMGFEYTIYLLVPVHDIMRGTHGDTLDTLNRVSPKPVIGTAQLFLDAPKKYYYAFDGHLNAEGSRRVAEFLISTDEAKGAQFAQ